MYKDEQERLSKYGKLICDFANAKTTDDILTSLFENLQSAFNFSSDFKKKALNRYPTKQMLIGKLSEKEVAVFKKILSRNETLHWFENFYCFHIQKYDSLNSMFTLLNDELVDRRSDDGSMIETYRENKTLLIPKNNIEEYINNLPFHEIVKKNIKVKIKTLINLCDRIEKTKPDVTKPYKEMEINADVYSKLIPHNHHLVAKTQRELKLFLLQFIESESRYKSKYFDNLLSIYNEIPKSEYAINNCKLIEINPLDEDYFLNNPSFSPSFYTDAHLFDTIISYCLIEYLKNPEYCGRERMAVCPICNCIFSKSKLNGKQKYCPVCSRKNKMTPEERATYQKAYRANPARKRAIARQEREERIRHLMAEAGKTRKQAEIIIDNEM